MPTSASRVATYWLPPAPPTLLRAVVRGVDPDQVPTQLDHLGGGIVDGHADDFTAADRSNGYGCGPTSFLYQLQNTLLVSVINFTVWFAITFYVYLQTRSVFATGVVAGIFLVATALTGIWFGSLVDHHRKKTTMQASAAVSLVAYAICFGIYQMTPHQRFADPTSVILWVFIVLLMAGVIAGNIRSIALPTLVTVLIEEDRRDKANGLVGSTLGVSFLITSVVSGLLVGVAGMFWVLLLAMAVLVLALVHLAVVKVPEPAVPPTAENASKVDLRGTYGWSGACRGWWL